MAKATAYRTPVLVLPPGVTKDQLATVLDRLVATDAVSTEIIEAHLGTIRAETNLDVKEASAVKELSPEQLARLLKTLQARFETHKRRHEGINWAQVQARLAEAAPEKLWSLNEMERTGGEPDVVGLDQSTGEIVFEDRAAESPYGRRYIEYDRKMEDWMKQSYPKSIRGNMVDMAAAMGVVPLDKARYLAAQEEEKKAYGTYMDKNSRSWVKTPVDAREVGFSLVGHCLGGIVYMDNYDSENRGDNIGFRGSLRI